MRSCNFLQNGSLRTVLVQATWLQDSRFQSFIRDLIESDTGVKFVYLLPYSPDFNRIEEFVVELKIFLRRNWSYHAEDPTQGFS
jgi:transposase